MARHRRGKGEGTIYRRKDGLWAGQVIVGFRPDGQPKRQTVYGKTRATVVEKMTAILADKANGTLVSPTRQTVGEFLRTWFAHHSRFAGRGQEGLRPNTTRIYERMIRLHITPALGSFPLRDLCTPGGLAQLKALYKEMVERKGLSVRMAEIADRLLHAALETAVEERILPRNPCDMIKDKPRARYNPQHRPVLPRDRVGEVLALADGSTYYLPLLIAMATGMRRAEIVGLRWANVDLQARVIRVREQLQADRHGRLTLQPLKTESSSRDIPLPGDLIQVLRQVRETAAPEIEFVCATRSGKPIRPDNLDHAWATIRRKLDLPRNLTFHDLRHSFTNWLVEKGVDIKTVSAILGHRSELFTLSVYRSVTPLTRREAARAMEGIASNDGREEDNGKDGA
jgi:integrase